MRDGEQDNLKTGPAAQKCFPIIEMDVQSHKGPLEHISARSARLGAIRGVVQLVSGDINHWNRN